MVWKVPSSSASRAPAGGARPQSFSSSTKVLCGPLGDFGDVPEIDQAPVSADVNGDGLKTVLPATGNEWLALVYDAGGRIGHWSGE